MEQEHEILQPIQGVDALNVNRRINTDIAWPQAVSADLKDYLNSNLIALCLELKAFQCLSREGAESAFRILKLRTGYEISCVRQKEVAQFLSKRVAMEAALA